MNHWTRPFLLLCVTCASVLAIAATASATVLSPTSSPLSGTPASNFQGGDGNQINESGYVDWQSAAANNKVVLGQDSTTNDSCFGSPNQKQLNPGGWVYIDCKDGVNPAKDNLLAGWSSVDQPGDTYLNLAFTREVQSGNTYLAFELNQEKDTFRNPVGHDVPCRKGDGDGPLLDDLIISYQVLSGGSPPNVDIVVHRWKTITASAVDPRGCALTGVVDELDPQPNAQGAVNAGSIANFLPTDSGDPDAVPPVPPTIPPNLLEGTFGEASLNLSGFYRSILDNRPCFHFGAINMESHASTSFTSDLKDFIGPFAVPIANCSINIEKTVKLSSDATYGETATGPVGSVFNYKFEVTVPSGSRPLRVTSLADAFNLAGGGVPQACTPSNLTGDDGDSLVEPGETWVYTCNYTAQAGDPARGAMQNTATVVGKVTGCDGSVADCGATDSDTASITVTKKQPTISTTAQTNVTIGTNGQATITDTARLQNGTTGATGTVTFHLYRDDLGACGTEVAGSPVTASVTSGADDDSYTSPGITVTQAGTYHWTASYGGDANNDSIAETTCPFPGGSEDSVVNKRQPTISTTAQTNVTIGTNGQATITDTARLQNGTTGATGTVTFHLYRDDNGACGTEVAGSPVTASLTSGADDDSYTSPGITVTQAGTYHWTASYSGDTTGNNLPVAETTCPFPGGSEDSVVNPRQPTVVTTATNAVLGADGKATIGDSATLSGGPSNAGGSLTFRVYSDAACNNLVATAAPATAVSGADGDTYQSAPVEVSAAGTYYWSVEYSGDLPNNQAIAETACGLTTGGNSERSVVPDLKIQKTADASSVEAGQSVGFTITVTGSGPARDVVLNDDLPSGPAGNQLDWSISGAVTGDETPTCSISGAVGSEKLHCDAVDLGAGTNGATEESYTVHVVSATSATGPGFTTNNQAIASSSNHPDVPSDDDVEVVALGIDKKADASPVPAGSPVGFTITVTGSGPARDVVLNDDLPSGPAGNQLDWSISGAVAGDETPTCSISGAVGSEKLHCDAVDLGAGADFSTPESYTVHVVSQTSATGTGFSVSNTAVAGASNHSDVQDTATVRVVRSALAVVKDGSPGTVHDGEPITFTYAVTNPATDPVVVDSISDDKCSAFQGPTKTGGNQDGLLEPGETWTYTCTAPADHTTETTDGSGGRIIVNTVTVKGHDETTGAKLEATDDHTTRVIHPAIAIDKTGPATAEAGGKVSYALTVTNPGDTAFADSTVKVADQQCNGDPVTLIGKGGDTSPGSLDPGDTWTYSCSVQTAAGQTAIHNVATVTGCDRLDKCVSGDDDADTQLTQPAQIVAGERIVPGTARLLGPTGCAAKSFNARVRGTKVASVVFILDGKVVKRLRKPNAKGLYQYRINPKRLKVGVHRLVTNITFEAGSGTKPRTLRLSFQRCARKLAAPRFTG